MIIKVSVQVNILIVIFGFIFKCENDYMFDQKIIYRYFLFFVGWILDNSIKDFKFVFINLILFIMYDVYVAVEISVGIGFKLNILIFIFLEGKNIFFNVLMRYFCFVCEFYCVG